MTTMAVNYWLLWLNLAALCLCSRLESGFFTKHSTDGARLSHRYTHETTSSILSCCLFCLRESSCLSVSFEYNTRTCDLFNNTHVDSSFTTEEGWVSYMKNKIGCPEGWTSHDDRCYLFETQFSNWMSAVDTCSGKGGYLAEINSEDENDYLKQHILGLGTGTCFWVGGTDEHTENDWKWVTSGTPITFMGWYNGEPNGYETENCLVFKRHDQSYVWIDFSCSSLCYVICEMEI